LTINLFIKTVKNPQHLIIHSEIGPPVIKAEVYVNQDKSVSDLQTLIKHSFLLYFPRELLMNYLILIKFDQYVVLAKEIC
jgi:hypothetical protein